MTGFLLILLVFAMDGGPNTNFRGTKMVISHMEGTERYQFKRVSQLRFTGTRFWLWEAVEDFLASRPHMTEKTVYANRMALNHFLSWLEKSRIDIANKNVLQWYLGYFKRYRKSNGKHYKPTTINAYLSTVKTFCNYLREEKVIDWNPYSCGVKGLSLEDEIVTEAFSLKTLKRFFKALECSKHFDEANVRNKAIFYVLTYTALRQFPLQEACIEDVIDRDGELYIKVRKKRGFGKTKDKYLPEAAAQALRDYLETYRQDAGPEEPLFVPIKERRKSKYQKLSTYRYFFNLIKKRARLHGTKLTPHSFRRGVATIMDKEGKTLREIAEYLDHADPRTTDRHYIKRENSQKKLSRCVSRAFSFLQEARAYRANFRANYQWGVIF